MTITQTADRQSLRLALLGVDLVATRELAAGSKEQLRDPLDVLASLHLLRQHLDDVERAAVATARAEGASWTQVGAALNVSKQAVQQRHGRA